MPIDKLCLGAGLTPLSLANGTQTIGCGRVDSGVQVTDNWVITARHVGCGVGGVHSNGCSSSTIAARYNQGSGAPVRPLGSAAFELRRSNLF